MRTIFSVLHRALFLSLLEGILWLLSVPVFAAEYFAGPFPSWTNVKSAPYNATGNGTNDDTAAIQNAINAVNASHSVVYLPPGTYKISAPLTVQNLLGFSFVGDDPSTTKITWAGPAGGTMMLVYSTAMAKWGRITWEGSSGGVSGVGAAIGIGFTCPAGNCGAGYGPTNLLHFDEVFQNMGKGIAGGIGAAPDNSEVTITRTLFQNCSFAGLSIESSNALDYWVWDSQFLNNREGITNEVSAGNFMAYRCLFQNSSVADLIFVQTGFFSFRNNTSIGSNQFINGGGSSASARVALQGNKILDTINPVSIELNNVGPAILVDNQIRSLPVNSASTSVIQMNPNSASSGDLISIGNVYSAANPITVYDTGNTLLSNYQPPRWWSQEDVTRASTITSTLPVMPPAATHLTANIIEVAAGSSAASIQSAINAAVPLAGSHPVIHLPAGTYNITQTIMVPANLDVLIVGDNSKTRLNSNGAAPIFQLAGPSKATIRDMELSGAAGDAVQILGADQAGARVFAEGLYLDTQRQGDVLADSLANAHVDLQGLQPSRAGLVSVKSIGTGFPGASRVGIFGGAAGTTGGIAPTNGWMYEVSNGGRMAVEDTWYESGDSPIVVNLANGDSGVLALWGGNIGQGSSGGNAPPGPPMNLDGFNGQASFLDLNLGLNAGSTVLVANETSQTQALFLGLSGPSSYFNRSGSGGTVVFNNNKGGGIQIPDQGNSRTPAFIDNQLALLRNSADQEVPLTADTPSGVTDARIYRVNFTNNGIGLHITSSNSTPPTATFTPPPGVSTATLTMTATAARTAPPTSTSTSSDTFTSSSTPTFSSTASSTPSATFSYTPSSTPTSSWTASSTSTQSFTSTSSFTASSTSTSSYTPTSTSTASFTLSSTPPNTPSSSPTSSWTASSTSTSSFTSTASFTASSTFTPSFTSTSTSTSTSSATFTSSSTPTSTSTASFTSSATSSDTPSSSPTSSWTASSTSTPSFTSTESFTASFTFTPSFTPTESSTASFTPSATLSNTPSSSPTDTFTPTWSSTYTFTSTFTLTFTTTPIWTSTATSTAKSTATPTATSWWRHWRRTAGMLTLTNTPTPIPMVSAMAMPSSPNKGTGSTANSPAWNDNPTPSPTSIFLSNTLISPPYPNPSSGQPVKVDIHVSSPSEINLTVFTLSGRRIYGQALEITSDETISWNLLDLQGAPTANGVYYLRVQVNGIQPLVKWLKVLQLK